MLRKSYANPIGSLLIALRLDRGRWIWLLLIVFACAVLLALGDSSTGALRYDRAAIEAGQWWRLWSAHFVHADAHHLVLNALGFVLVWALFIDDYRPREWLLIAAVSAPVISLGLFLLDPGLEWYVGASGLLHALMAAGCIRHLYRRDWDRYLLSAGLAIKLTLEQFSAHGTISAPPGQLAVIVDAHLLGAASGAVLGLIFCSRATIIFFRSTD